MIQWFFFNRIDTKTCAQAVGREHHFVALVFAHEAKTAIALFQLARSRAKVAKDALAVFNFMPVASRIIYTASGFRLLRAFRFIESLTQIFKQSISSEESF